MGGGTAGGAMGVRGPPQCHPLCLPPPPPPDLPSKAEYVDFFQKAKYALNLLVRPGVVGPHGHRAPPAPNPMGTQPSYPQTPHTAIGGAGRCGGAAWDHPVVPPPLQAYNWQHIRTPSGPELLDLIFQTLTSVSAPGTPTRPPPLGAAAEG